MYCYKCGCELNKSDHCPNCGADVAAYKRIIYTSNYMYNEGLERARVKDLSGAILCLKQSLWCNKDNLDARNLLGLVYYEIGEVVAAFSEWVISQNINNDRLHYKKNLADTYLKQFQEGSQTLENIHASIERYNHALECCYTDNLDVAALQLKKVLQLNSHYLRARQLLALLYIEDQQWARADRELHKCLLLDVNNTTTLRYLAEVNAHKKADPEAAGAGAPAAKGRRRKDGGVIKYTEDNEMIIQPVGGKRPGVDGFRFPQAITGGIIGLIVGAAAIAFLIMPARVQAVRAQSAEEVRQVSAQLDQKDATISDLQSKVDKAADEASTKSDTSKTSTANDNALMAAAGAYLTDAKDTDSITTAFDPIDPATAKDGAGAGFTSLYDALFPLVRSDMLDKYYLAGAKAYEASTPDYATTIKNLVKALEYDDASNPSQAYPQMLYYLGDSYYQSYQSADSDTQKGEMKDYLSNAKAYLQKLVKDYPKSEYVQDANNILTQIPDNVKAADIFADADDADTADSASSADSSSDASSAGSTKKTDSQTSNSAAQASSNNNASNSASAASSSQQNTQQTQSSTAASSANAGQSQQTQDAAAAQAAAQQQAEAQIAAQAQANYEAAGMTPEQAAAQVQADQAAGLY